MDGFKLYVTNISTIPPDGYLCYEDTDQDLPNITQTIPCNKLGKYVIYYDAEGSMAKDNQGPIVELCYVAINGCQASFWGSNCENDCAEKCIERNCFPGNGSCVWGCNPKHCLNDICNKDTAVCTVGCNERRRTGSYCDMYNIAYDGVVWQSPSGSQQADLANDGNKTSCSKTIGSSVAFHVELKGKSIVTGMYIILGDGTTKEGHHTFYASNESNAMNSGTVLYNGTFLPTEINFEAVFKFLTYVPPVQIPFTELELCEIGIIGCPPTHYGPLCNTTCPQNCNGPCDLDVGNCIFGCIDGWTGTTCEQDCPSGQFGRNCSEFCDGCVSSMCDHVSGMCDNTTSCKHGYRYSEYCDISCDDWKFGRNSEKICNCLTDPCSKGDGICPHGGCKEGWHGESCNKETAMKIRKISDFIQSPSSLSKQNSIPEHVQLLEDEIRPADGVHTIIRTPKSSKKVAVRNFREQWCHNRPWLKYHPETKSMYCTICQRAQAKNVFSVEPGCTVLKLENITKHEAGKGENSHSASEKILNAGQQFQTAQRKLLEKSEASVTAAMRNIYFMAQFKLSNHIFADFNQHCINQGCSDLIGLKVDKHTTYEHSNSIHDFQQAVSTVIIEDIINSLDNKPYSIMIDESTDISVDQNLLIYIRFLNQSLGKFEPKSCLLGVRKLRDGAAAGKITQEIFDLLAK
ncbi:MEGF10_11 [Mytilus coruscus]|uniref:MEGF10_11 n=1 Tax=Mytilus coruscus TaxID=42192 RepID=A0A6J8EES3_MYTCO|nr:MEGF10_11 [Mytilus coruscus]